MICYFKILLLLTIILPFDQIDGNKNELQNKNQNYKIINSNSTNIIHKSINPLEYIVGPGDTFSFNMIIPNRILNLELIVSATSSILIPGIGVIDVKGKTLDKTYAQIINVCKEIHEDAYVYVNISKLRNFKILISGDTNYSGMHSVSSTDRVSDLVERVYVPNSFDSILVKVHPELSINSMLDKDLFIKRNDTLIEVNLFNYFHRGDFDGNPNFLEGDNLIIKNSNKLTVLGEVELPSRINYDIELSYNDLINIAGGLKPYAEKNNILILNKSFFNAKNLNNKHLSMNLNSKNRSDLDESYLKTRMEMLDGIIKVNDFNNLDAFINGKVSINDVVVIPQQINFIEIIGGVNNPGIYKFEKEKFLNDYIFIAGGLSESANKNNYYLIDKINGSKTKIYSNYKINRGDIIFVEYDVGYKKWDRFTQTVDLISRISTTLLVLYNFWSATNGS
tara:strand:+ start:76 stop:1425 length:1350 start_codon:yes stop_codon:yes gene_type:complete